MAFTDNFTGTAGEKLHARSGWTKLGSGYDLYAPEINASNQLRVYSDTSDVALIGQEISDPDHYAQANVYAGFSWSGTNARSFICVRSVDRNSYWAVSHNSSEGVWELMSPLGRDQTYSAALSSGDLVRIEAEGNTIRVFINGTKRLENTSASYLNTNTAVGFLGRGTPGSDPVIDNWESGAIGAADTTAPTLSSATASATSGTTATGGVTTDEAGPAWAVLTTSSTTPSAAQIKAGQDHTGAAASASDTATLAVGANPGVFDFTGLTSGGTYWPHVVQDDTATPANTSTPITSASSFTTPAPDTTAPTFTGSITVGAKTSSTIALTLPTATDNVAVTGYEYRVDAGAWVDNGNSTAVSITGLTALTSYTIDARAYDAAANASTTLSVTTSTYRAGASAGSIVTATGPTGGNPAGFLYALAQTLPTSDWVSYYIVSGPTPSGGTLDAQVNGAFSYFGPEPATLVIQPEVNGVEGDQIIVTLYDQTPDTTAPTFTGSITVAARTTTTITLTLPTATDDTAVTGYEYRVDGGAWTDNGLSTTVALTGLTELTSYTIDARAYDAVPNYSTTLSVTTSTFGTSSSPSGKKTPNGMISFWNR